MPLGMGTGWKERGAGGGLETLPFNAEWQGIQVCYAADLGITKGQLNEDGHSACINGQR